MRRCRDHWFTEHWFIAIRPARDPLLPESMDGFRVVQAPRGHWYSDPFLLEFDGRRFLFFEDYLLAKRRGRISYCEVLDDGTVGDVRVALELDTHISYPSVFVHDGIVRMIPESYQAGQVALYRAPSFPGRFQLERVLLAGVAGIDPTLFDHENRLWLLLTLEDAPPLPEGSADLDEPLNAAADASDEIAAWQAGESAKLSRTLYAYWSDSLEGDWQEHPGNPLVRGLASARPGGAVLRSATGVIRPAQDCRRRYGEALVFCEIERLTPREFREHPLARVEADWIPGNLGTHTYARDSAFEAVDGHWLTSGRAWFDLLLRALGWAIDGERRVSIKPEAARRVSSLVPGSSPTAG